jgi:apolipoprotein D and lipocalin family protein
MLSSLLGCSSRAPMNTVPRVDLERFMGDWYVLAHVPSRAEKEAYNAVETYTLGENGRIETTYAFRRGGFDEEVREMHPVGFVEDEATKATWGMRFIWPIRAEYLIVHLDAEYSETIVARTKRDYAWIMARQPELPAGRLEALEDKLVELGYDRDAIRRVPQRWPDPGHPVSDR